MNFFEHQDRARRQSRWLVLLFALAVIAIVLAVNLLMLAVLGRFESPEQGWFSPDFWLYNGEIVLWSTAATVVVIGLGSVYRSLQLRGGGAQVARELGGVEVEASTTDPLRRRLRNVVEEIAIASGVPVPAIFVLEHESGINAFAAGWSPADAAVAVTRGTLETLDRDELQGVIAHEFSHVFNGDMRLNIRLMGILFGILVMAILGRRMLISMRFSGRNRNAGAVMLFGLAVMVIGYIGLFFGRAIQAAVSRQRELLADASAVQFTRDPGGIAGALKKIGARSSASHLSVDSSEVGHMLFARGLGRQLFATHPPLTDRIRAIEPGFDPAEFERIAADLARHRQARQAESEPAHPAGTQSRGPDSRGPDSRGPGGLPLDADGLAEAIGQPGLEQVFLAGALLASVPAPLERAAHSDEWAMEVVCYLLLDADAEIREAQLLMIAEALGSEADSQVRALARAAPELPREARLPVLEMAFPALRRQPEADLVRFMDLTERLIHADERVDVFEYALGRLLGCHIQDVLSAPETRPSGRERLDRNRDHALALLAILARHGHPDDGERARAAFTAGAGELVDDPPEQPPAGEGPWPQRMDAALQALNRLRPADKQRLVAALTRCVQHDGEVVSAEIELLRAICGSLHVPLPLAEDRPTADSRP